jgi:SAM-dependent methyltransferase
MGNTNESMKNYYGSLCTQMYEILHEKAPEDELNFYLSYGKKGQKILEPLCGSGRFLVPFLEMGFDISGMDLSREMLEKLKEKAPRAKVIQADLTEYVSEELFDYIFISSGSVSLFTDMEQCKSILRKLKERLAPGGKFVFAVDTIVNRCEESSDYKTSVSVTTKEGLELVLKSKNHYDEESQTQFSPAVYELYRGAELLQSESMDFQTHLYRFGEMENYLKELGFTDVRTYSSFEKEIAVNDRCELFLFECSLGE